MSHLAFDTVLIVNVALFIVSVFHMFLHLSFPIFQDINCFSFAKRERRKEMDTGLAFTCVCCVDCV